MSQLLSPPRLNYLAPRTQAATKDLSTSTCLSILPYHQAQPFRLAQRYSRTAVEAREKAWKRHQGSQPLAFLVSYRRESMAEALLTASFDDTGTAYAPNPSATVAFRSLPKASPASGMELTSSRSIVSTLLTLRQTSVLGSATPSTTSRRFDNYPWVLPPRQSEHRYIWTEYVTYRRRRTSKIIFSTFYSV